MDSYQSLRPGEQFSIFKDCYSELRSQTRAFWVKASSYSELRRFINFLRFGEVGKARYPSRLATSDDSLATASGKTEGQAISRGVRKPVAGNSGKAILP